MRLDRDLVTRGTWQVAEDLARSFGPSWSWSCELLAGNEVQVQDGLGLTVTWPVEIEFHLAGAWPSGSLGDDDVDGELEAAVAAVAEAAQRAMERAVGSWPWCPIHATRLWADFDQWVCPAPRDVAPVGELPATAPWAGGRSAS